jgi:short-subunit dehydrogenase
MSGKVVVITGASGGIGAAMARRLGAQGCRLVLAARRERELKQVAAACEQAEAVVTDVCRREEVERLRDAALEAFGGVDVWINNAGRGITRNVAELTDEDFDEMMTVNVKSALYGIQAILPHFMQRGEGHLINMSSFLSRVPLVAYRSAYNAAKSALNALTANLRMELAAKYPRIHVSLAMPAMVATDFARNAIGGKPFTTAAGRAPQVQSADEVAAAIAELIEHPQAEIYTQPASADMVRRYYQDVATFEATLRT